MKVPWASLIVLRRNAAGEENRKKGTGLNFHEVKNGRLVLSMKGGSVRRRATYEYTNTAAAFSLSREESSSDEDVFIAHSFREEKSPV